MYITVSREPLLTINSLKWKRLSTFSRKEFLFAKKNTQIYKRDGRVEAIVREECLKKHVHKDEFQATGARIHLKR